MYRYCACRAMAWPLRHLNFRIALQEHVSRGIQVVQGVIQDPARDGRYEDGATIGAVLQGLHRFAREIIWIASGGVRPRPAFFLAVVRAVELAGRAVLRVAEPC